MKFLLVAIHAKYIHTGLAVYSLRSYVGQGLREHVEVAEYTINQSMEDILADIYRRKADVIGFSCYIWNFQMVKKLTREFHKLRSEVPIWLGGPEVSYEYEKVFEGIPEVTGIMLGEGEETFRELLESYVKAVENNVGNENAENSSVIESGTEKKSNEKNMPEKYAAAEKNPEIDNAKKDRIRENSIQENRINRDLRGLKLTLPGTVTRNGFYGIRKPLNMDRLPFYYDDLSGDEEAAAKNKIIYYESSRGCPFRCSYCLSSIEKQVRLRNVELVKRELQYFLDKKVKQVKFIDRTFNCNKEHAVEIWRFLSEHDNGVTNFHFEISAELLTEEELEILSQMRAGLIQLEIGVQTTNQETLRAIHRPADLEKLKKAVAAVRGFHNIHQHLDLIVGLPYEDIRSFRKSFHDVYAMKPNQLQLGFLKVLKGSEMYDRAGEYGIVYQSESPYEVLYTKWLSYEDVQELKKVEKMLELFYNSGQFAHTLPMLEKLFETPYDMFLALAEFYEEKGYFINSPARNYRYEIVLEFVKSRGAGEEAEKLFRELLTFDVYLREKAKSRPSFAKDIRDRYQKIYAFYKKQEEEPTLLSAYTAKGYDSRQMMRMTHTDIFCYPVWDEKWIEGADIGRITAGEEQFVLFDYEKRNPLNYEAEAVLI